LRLPAISGLAVFANGGGLISHGPNFVETSRPREIGVTIPQSILLRADRVIE